jgi:hypothetical protein
MAFIHPTNRGRRAAPFGCAKRSGKLDALYLCIERSGESHGNRTEKVQITQDPQVS